MLLKFIPILGIIFILNACVLYLSMHVILRFHNYFLLINFSSFIYRSYKTQPFLFHLIYYHIMKFVFHLISLHKILII